MLFGGYKYWLRPCFKAKQVQVHLHMPFSIYLIQSQVIFFKSHNKYTVTLQILIYTSCKNESFLVKRVPKGFRSEVKLPEFRVFLIT